MAKTQNNKITACDCGDKLVISLGNQLSQIKLSGQDSQK